MYVDHKRILSATDGGLQIILSYYPQAANAVKRRGHKFKTRSDEKTPSTTLKQLTDGNWVVTDFGGDATPRNGIMVCAHEEGITFVEACQMLAGRFGITPEQIDPEKYKPIIDTRDATADEADGDWLFDVRDSFTDLDITTVLADHAIPYTKAEPGAAKTINYDKINQVFRLYHFYSLVSYSIVKNRKVTTISATDTYPIMMWDEGSFKKIYQPLSFDKSRRFMYYGTRDKNFLHGLSQAHAAFEQNIPASAKEIIDEDSGEVITPAPEKLDEVLYVSGGSDGLNLAMIGYQPVWPNSETAKLTEQLFKKLTNIAKRVINIPDIDTTGIRAAHDLAMQHLDLYTATLPADLRQRYDRRGNPSKDVRDYLRHYNAYDLKEILKVALPYQFWGIDYSKTKSGHWKETYTVLNTEMYNFLVNNGFNRLDISGRKGYIHRQGNIVKEVDSSFIRDYVNDFLRDRKMNPRLRDVFYNTPKLSESSTANIPITEVEFNDHDAHTQYFFFQNGVTKVTSTAIEYFKPGIINRNTWEDEVIDHKIKIQEPQFKIFTNTDGDLDIDILKTDSIFLNFLVNTSRIFWRKELETSLEGLKAEEIKKYHLDHKFDIAGPRLAPDEIREQKQHLINKIFTIGYLLHRYKDPSKPWAPFGTDHKISEDGESHGGSGKSFFFKALSIVMNNVTIDGKKPKLFEDNHLWENVTQHTDYILIDDLAQYANFESFFSIITGSLTVNGKNIKRVIIDESESPKIAITSNYVPQHLHPSHRRRLIFVVFADYYHEQSDIYNETRKISDDFGKNILKDGYTDQEWSDFYNFLMQACQFYLTTSTKINPPMDNVEKRNLISQMGTAFHEWADVYFSTESNRLDTKVEKTRAFEEFKHDTASKISSHRFRKCIEAWVKYYGYELNPTELANNGTRIVENVTRDGRTTTVEMIYIATKKEVAQDIKTKGPAPF